MDTDRIKKKQASHLSKPRFIFNLSNFVETYGKKLVSTWCSLQIAVFVNTSIIFIFDNQQCWMLTVTVARLPLTFIVSSLWHGVYAGYYLCLCSVPLYLPAEDRFYKAWRNNTIPPPVKHFLLYRHYFLSLKVKKDNITVKAEATNL